jgi:hypothetical protein
LLTPLLNLWIWGVDILLFLRCNDLKVDAMHMLAKTLCTCSCGMVLMMHVRMTRLATWWASDCGGKHRQGNNLCGESLSPIKIPSVLLVEVVWLQHTRCPRSRRGPLVMEQQRHQERDRIWVRSFHVNAC